ncbi:recombinase RecA [Myxococcus sp. AM011]|uniref:ATPase domain-containing protein n=1 Tax=Myxococcus sp. AM011 TaxID=2745200 RepID=UPI00159533C6|nr:ATPase domain-containing protein [Myxococcus sp. AM011]NVJ24417.1 recombinase RecA [Myxococcus sp. AM011]
MIAKKTSLEFETTGDVALDRILGGGIPARSMVVIAGEPGSGKTVLTLQMLFHAARQGKKCLYFTTLSEPALKVIRYMQLFDFFDVELLDKQVIFVDLGGCVREGAERTLAEIEARVEKHEPDFVAIDSFRAIGELLQHQGVGARPFIYDLAVQTASWGATTLLAGEYTRDEFPVFAEFAVADGIIRLGSERQELTSVREMEVLKLRGAGYTSGRHFFDISKAGVSFYPRVSTPEDTQVHASADAGVRATMGVEGLDDLLGGGLPGGSATVVQGGTGSGKTLLSLQFLLEGARKGEKGVLFTLEESPDQLRSIARSVGWDLASFEAQGKLVIRYTSPVELSTDRFLYEARKEVRELGATRAVFDSLTTMSLGVPSDRRYKEMVYAIAKHMRAAGVTLLMTVESEQLLGTATISGHGVSFIADNLIQLRYVEIGNKLERAISVLKARGIKHNSELRSMTVGADGLKVIEGRFRDLRGVLTGLPTRESRDTP